MGESGEKPRDSAESGFQCRQTNQLPDDESIYSFLFFACRGRSSIKDVKGAVF